jgi:hypothetical protein
MENKEKPLFTFFPSYFPNDLQLPFFDGGANSHKIFFKAIAGNDTNNINYLN